MNKNLPYKIMLLSLAGFILFTPFLFKKSTELKNNRLIIEVDNQGKLPKISREEKQLFSEKRLEYELQMQRNPYTGEVPLEEKAKELNESLQSMKQQQFARVVTRSYVSRGPSNKGGRTRAVRIDLSDDTSNTILSGGVSSGLFRTTNGGDSWVKVSPNDDIHNVTALAQDPRTGFQNIWYYATGERVGNSASLGSAYRGRGIWKSIDNGVTWSQIAITNSPQETFQAIDYIMALEVSPINGDLMIAGYRRIYRYDGDDLNIELENESGGRLMTDLVINSSGRVFAAFEGNASTQEGVWTSPTGNGEWTRIAQNGDPENWNATGRIVLSNAPSNDNVIYALYQNGKDNEEGELEADLWKYDLSTDTWTNYSDKLPDEEGGDLAGNDPFSIQGGYDLVVSVKPDDENFVLIGGTGAYRIKNIETDEEFIRIGGYASLTYASYRGAAGTDQHHADVHELLFDPNNFNQLFSGTDGGIHKTTDINEEVVSWKSLNNNYLTFQFYHIAIDPLEGSNIVFGGAQDNGTNIGGTNAGLANNSAMNRFFGGDGVAVGLARVRDNSRLQFFYGSQNGNIRTNKFIDSLGRNQFRSIRPEDSESNFVTYFYLDPDNTSNLYYAGENVLYKTNDSENITTTTWDNLGTMNQNEEEISRMAATRGTYNPETSYLLIGGQNGSILKLDDPKNAIGETALSSAKDISPQGFPTSNRSIVSGIAIHPTNPDIVLVTYSNYGLKNIFLTTNATDETPIWTEVEQNLNNHSIRSAAITIMDGQIIYFVGTARGLYSSTDPTVSDWNLEGQSTMGLPLISELAYRPSDSKLLIGTHGNGMYETDVRTLSTNNVNTPITATSLTVYPNPATTQISINKQFKEANNTKFTITDITGKTIQNGRLTNSPILIDNLKSGIYFLNIKDQNASHKVKFIKK